MTTVQRVAQVFGWVFVVVAIWGAVITGTSMEADPDLAPRLWGLFPVNFLHNLVHLLLGIWGIRAAGSVDDARTFTVVAGTLYIVLAVLGLFLPDGLGFLPIGGSDIWLHAAAGVALFGTGAAASSAVTATRVAPGRTRTVLPPDRLPQQERPTTGPAGPGLAEPAGEGGTGTDATLEEEPPEKGAGGKGGSGKGAVGGRAPVTSRRPEPSDP